MNDKTEICCHISFAHREMRIKNETKSDDECICKKKNTTILFRILFHLVVKSFFSLAKFIDLSVEGLRRIGWKSKLLLNYIAMIVTELAVLMFNSINYLIFSLKSFSNCTYPKKIETVDKCSFYSNLFEKIWFMHQSCIEFHSNADYNIPTANETLAFQNQNNTTKKSVNSTGRECFFFNFIMLIVVAAVAFVPSYHISFE